jgi:hypothetical protein
MGYEEIPESDSKSSDSRLGCSVSLVDKPANVVMEMALNEYFMRIQAFFISRFIDMMMELFVLFQISKLI